MTAPRCDLRNVRVEGIGGHARQVLARRENGEPFSRYVECTNGCGYLIGVGEAWEDAAHELLPDPDDPLDRAHVAVFGAD